METYSGFNSRKQEIFYDKTLEKLFKLMTNRLLQHYKPEPDKF